MGPSTSPRLVLASSSPRRREIICLLGIPFEVMVNPVAEDVAPGERPEEAAKRVAVAKAKAVAQDVAVDAVVVGADTMVVLDGRILGKPADEAEAASMLRDLRGRKHSVVTGVAVIGPRDRLAVTATSTAVLMRNYGDREIAAYIASGEPMDKAGGYGIQSSVFAPASQVVGCYLNVVGLPLCAVVTSLCAVGFHVPPVNRPELSCVACEGGALLAKGCT